MEHGLGLLSGDAAVLTARAIVVPVEHGCVIRTI